MHQTKKGNQWYRRFAEGFAYGVKVLNRHAEAKGYGVEKDTGLIHSVETRPPMGMTSLQQLISCTVRRQDHAALPPAKHWSALEG